MKEATELHLREVPTGFPANVGAFKDSCLILGIIVAYGTELVNCNRHGTTDAEKRLIGAIKDWYCSPSKDSKEKMNNAGEVFKAEISRLQDQLKEVENWQEVDTVCISMASHLNVQINVIDKKGPKRIAARYPKTFQKERPQLYLLREPASRNYVHIVVIANSDTFWDKNNSYVCPPCLRQLSSPYARHWCPSLVSPSCKSCIRHRLTPAHYFTRRQYDMDQICLEGDDDWEDIEEFPRCPVCNVRTMGPKCYLKHKCSGYVRNTSSLLRLSLQSVFFSLQVLL